MDMKDTKASWIDILSFNAIAAELTAQPSHGSCRKRVRTFAMSASKMRRIMLVGHDWSKVSKSLPQSDYLVVNSLAVLSTNRKGPPSARI